MEVNFILSLATIFGMTYVGVTMTKAIKSDRDRRAYETAMNAAGLTELARDKYGNEFDICKKCKVPVILDGILIKCLNGCDIGIADLLPYGERPSKQNNYNPTIFTQCSNCRGNGKEHFKEVEDWCVKMCDQCNGEGGFQSMKYSPNEEEVLSQPQLLTVDDEGRANCQKCGFRFYVTDKNVWSEDRHAHCGQKLVLPDVWRKTFNSQLNTDANGAS